MRTDLLVPTLTSRLICIHTALKVEDWSVYFRSFRGGGFEWNYFRTFLWDSANSHDGPLRSLTDVWTGILVSTYLQPSTCATRPFTHAFPNEAAAFLSTDRRLVISVCARGTTTSAPLPTALTLTSAGSDNTTTAGLTRTRSAGTRLALTSVCAKWVLPGRAHSFAETWMSAVTPLWITVVEALNV